MNRDIQSSWMFSPKSFISLLGAEYHLMRDAGVLRRFYASSLLIVIIMLLTGISIEYALDLLFHAIAVQVALAVFFCLLFFCIYIFLLNTFAKENRVRNGIWSMANIIRMGFVAFMGFLVAQPLIILLYSAALTNSVDNYKQQLLKNHTAKIGELTKDEMKKLVNEQQYYLDQKKRFGTSTYDRQLKQIDDKIAVIQAKTAGLNHLVHQAIENNSFFLFQVAKVNGSYPLSWFLALLIILLFLMPGYLIYTISSQHEYYRLKKAREKELIKAAYNVFVARYQSMFIEGATIFSRYDDPPFNTVRKQPRAPSSTADFLKKYLHND